MGTEMRRKNGKENGDGNETEKRDGKWDGNECAAGMPHLLLDWKEKSS